MVSLGFKKAIDTIDQQILSSKVNLYGIQGKMSRGWFSFSYFFAFSPPFIHCERVANLRPFFFFFRDNEIISMTQERRRGEEPSLPFTPVPLAVLNNDGNQRLLHMGHRCKQARDFTNDMRVSWDESNCALSLCRLRWVWNFFRVLTIKHITETGPRHNTRSFHKLFWGGCMH